MGTRIFLKNISTRTTEQELNELFGKYGDVKKIDLKLGFGFLFYDNANDAQDAIKNMNGREVDGKNIIVEIARDSKDFGKNKPPKRLDLRLSVFNLDSRISWQDLKDWGREAGEVTFTNVFTRDSQQVGVIEFQDAEGMEKALRTLEDVPLKGIRVRLAKEDPSVHMTGGRYANKEPYVHRSTEAVGGYRGGYEDRGVPRGYDDRERGGYRGGYDRPERGYPPSYDAPPPHHRGGYDDGRGYDSRGGRYSEDYRRGGPPGGAAPFHGGGREPRSRSRSRDRHDSGRYYGGGGGGGYGPPPHGGYPPRGYDGGAPHRGYGGEARGGGGRYVEGGRGGGGGYDAPRGPR